MQERAWIFTVSTRAPPLDQGPLYALTTMGHQDATDEYVTSDTNAAAVQAFIQGRTAPRLPASETICTPLWLLEFERELASHPNKDFVQGIVQGIMLGIKIGYSSPQMSLISSNLPSAHLNLQVIEDSVQKECQAGRLAGPFPAPPLHSSGIGLSPKKMGDGEWSTTYQPQQGEASTASWTPRPSHYPTSQLMRQLQS